MSVLCTALIVPLLGALIIITPSPLILPIILMHTILAGLSGDDGDDDDGDGDDDDDDDNEDDGDDDDDDDNEDENKENGNAYNNEPQPQNTSNLERIAYSTI